VTKRLTCGFQPLLDVVVQAGQNLGKRPFVHDAIHDLREREVITEDLAPDLQSLPLPAGNMRQ
jgi:hypothetical protein